LRSRGRSAASESEPSCRGPPLGNCGACPAGYDVLDPSVTVIQASADEVIQRAEADAAVSVAETRIAETERQAQEAIAGRGQRRGRHPWRVTRRVRVHGTLACMTHMREPLPA
jgi:hypothetical protein